MNFFLEQCSLFVAVDNHYLDKLLVTYPTWVLCHPEILQMPHVFVYDAKELNVGDERWGKIAKMRELAAAREGVRTCPTGFSLIPWSMDHAAGISQREEMLTGLVRCTKAIHTRWYLKLDADTYANARVPFIKNEWFAGDPCYIASPWSYSKPPGTVAAMNTWAKGIPELSGFPDVPFVTIEGHKAKDKHHRMASWVLFADTDWTRRASALCTGPRLPTPSQDTYMSFIQAITKKHWVGVRFRDHGWEHCRNFGGLQAACAYVMATIGTAVDGGAK